MTRDFQELSIEEINAVSGAADELDFASSATGSIYPEVDNDPPIPP